MKIGEIRIISYGVSECGGRKIIIFLLMLLITITYSDFIKKNFSVNWGLVFSSSSLTVSSIYRAIA